MKFNNKAVQQIEKQTEEKDGNQVKVDQTVIKLLRYKRLTDDEHAFLILEDDTFAELLQLEGVGLATLSAQQVTNVLNTYLTFLRRYMDDITIITSLYPVEVETQRQYWIRKYDKAETDTQKRYIDDKIHMLDLTHEQKTNQEYMLVLFADTEEDLKTNIMRVRNWGGEALKPHRMTRGKKEAKLEQLNNMNMNSKD